MSRGSLRARLSLLCVVLVAASVATTAAIVSLSATASVQQQYTDDIASDTSLYNSLLSYAADHPSWTGLTSAALHRMGREVGRVALISMSGTVLVSSDGSPELPGPDAQPAATVNPLAPDSSLSTTTGPDGIDTQALGPFALSKAQLDEFDAAAAQTRGCLVKFGYTDVTVDHYLNGRAYASQHGFRISTQPDCDLPVITATASPTVAGPPTATSSPSDTAPQAVTASQSDTPGQPDTPSASVSAWPPSGADGAVAAKLRLAGLDPNTAGVLLDEPTASETAAARSLTALFGRCLKSSAAAMPDLYPDSSHVGFLDDLLGLALTSPQQACLQGARRSQLADYVAPPARLYIAGGAATDARHGLTRAAIERIGLAAAAILLVAVLAALAAAGGVTRPLRALTGAVEQVGRGQRRTVIPATGTREVAALAEAFNGMSSELAALETRRKELISDVAHELRTPLGNIRGWLEAVQDGLAAPDEPLVASLLDESLLLQAIIDDLQVLALADAEGLVVHPEPIDLAEVIEQVGASQLANAAAKGLSLTVQLAGDLRCTADAGRLRQALGNLLGNAIRYTSEGAVGITAEGDQDRVLITVADTGPGISPDDLEHVFDRFWRAEKSRDRRTGGSGLGLAIARHLVEAHGGKVEIASELGKGTVVTVRLPRPE